MYRCLYDIQLRLEYVNGTRSPTKSKSKVTDKKRSKTVPKMIKARNHPNSSTQIKKAMDVDEAVDDQKDDEKDDQKDGDHDIKECEETTTSTPPLTQCVGPSDLKSRNNHDDDVKESQGTCPETTTSKPPSAETERKQNDSKIIMDAMDTMDTMDEDMLLALALSASMANSSIEPAAVDTKPPMASNTKKGSTRMTPRKRKKTNSDSDEYVPRPQRKRRKRRGRK